ncbi:MAG TPA: hypothetical protein VFU13_01125 [Steroidobacteraceae bacterium]|nr:hypothetical protein [Steroidobacteraceae bacterium]
MRFVTRSASMRGVQALLLMALTLPAHAQSNSPATGLQRAQYQVFSGDYNGDGFKDILAKAKPKVIPIALDDLAIPIVIYASPTFVLMSNNGAPYSLVTKPASSIVNSSVWLASTHAVDFGDFLGNGVTSMMIRSIVPNGDSFTVTTSASVIQPSLLQRISSSDLGIDLGAVGRTTEFRDSNRDGRADLVVRTNGRITDVFIADTNGQFARATGNGSIEASWFAFRASLDANDPASALNFISITRRSKYSAAFQAIGTQLPNLTQRWSSFAAVRIVSSRFANYLITQTINGVATDYMITFVWENGRWVVAEL